MFKSIFKKERNMFETNVEDLDCSKSPLSKTTTYPKILRNYVSL